MCTIIVYHFKNKRDHKNSIIYLGLPWLIYLIFSAICIRLHKKNNYIILLSLHLLGFWQTVYLPQWPVTVYMFCGSIKHIICFNASNDTVYCSYGKFYSHCSFFGFSTSSAYLNSSSSYCMMLIFSFSYVWGTDLLQKVQTIIDDQESITLYYKSR